MQSLQFNAAVDLLILQFIELSRRGGDTEDLGALAQKPAGNFRQKLVDSQILVFCDRKRPQQLQKFCLSVSKNFNEEDGECVIPYRQSFGEGESFKLDACCSRRRHIRYWCTVNLHDDGSLADLSLPVKL